MPLNPQEVRLSSEGAGKHTAVQLLSRPSILGSQVSLMPLEVPDTRPKKLGMPRPNGHGKSVKQAKLPTPQLRH